MSNELRRLMSIKHIVVLMMENRSFDHMLGYLQLAGMPDVDGLGNAQPNPDDEGNQYNVHEFPPDQTAFHAPGDPYDTRLDPCHGPDCVAQQISGGNTGFVKNFIMERNPPADKRDLPMGYYTANHLPVYDHLARQYCVCDAWHSSIPGDTWPNRQYALAGQAGPLVKLKILQWLILAASQKKIRIPNPPLYNVPAFPRQLAEKQWRWYSHDPATLRIADGAYRRFRHLQHDNFAYFDRAKTSALTRFVQAPFAEAGDSFLDDVATGQLREVSWIDPNFIDIHVLHTISNDDHPPADVRAGQALALDVYDALLNGPDWDDTLLVIVYDEHGGFYDHVPPPPIDDGSGYPTLGVRVPALVIGPRVRPGVCHQTFDHTTLINTILRRFAADPDTALAAMGPRVANAPHLGMVLLDEPNRGRGDHGEVRNQIARWREDARTARLPGTANADIAAGAVSAAPDGAGQPLVLNEFQADFIKHAQALRDVGLPSGHP